MTRLWNDRVRGHSVRGAPGGRALAGELEDLVKVPASPVTTPRGLHARLNYLKTPAGKEAMERAGLNVHPDTIRKWARGAQSPRPENLARIEQADLDLRRRNKARYLKGRLNSGRGTRIEVYPGDETHVPAEQKRHLSTRDVQISGSSGIWDAAVDAWVSGNEDAMDDVWDLITDELGSDGDAYAIISGVAIL